MTTRALTLTVVALCMALVGAEALLARPAPAASSATGVAAVGTPDWRRVSVGGDHTCAIRTSGRLYCWGHDGWGQVGDGGAGGGPPKLVPTEVAGGHTDWVAVSAGANHTCALRASGRLYCWGMNGSHAVGNGSQESTVGAPEGDFPSWWVVSAPVEVLGNHSDWVAVSAGDGHTCGIRGAGTLFCWGADRYGQVGDGGSSGDTADPSPVAVAGGASNWTEVDAGSGHTCARRGRGRVYCWGDDRSGAIGDGGAFVSRYTPTQVAGRGTDWTSVAAGSSHSCGRRATGRLYCWGSDSQGQIGAGAYFGSSTRYPSPQQVTGLRTDWSGAVDVGFTSFSCARRTTGRLFCWGSDSHGKVGNADVPLPPLGFTDTPVKVAGGMTDWTRLDLGGDHACAIRSNRRLYCWGDNFFGQLGIGSELDEQSSPVEVAG